MPITCTNCGNTTHAPGARRCAICGAALPAPVAPAAPLPMLVTASGRRYRLSDAAETLIGSRGCAITLTEPGVSPRHARVFPSGSGFAVEDLGGGTQVNGQQIKAPCPLRPGDVITVGRASLVYQGSAAITGAGQPQPPLPPQQAITPPPVAPAVQPQKQVAPLKNWGRKQPIVEGGLMQIDGPYAKPRGYGQILMWFLRVEDFHSGREVSVVMLGYPSSMPQLGDVVAIWGRVKKGTVQMKKGYNYSTDSEIRLKK
jgi:hypothetical protein